jgi:hypothetical protein
MRRSTSDRLAPLLVVGAALAAFPTAAGHFFGGNQVAIEGGVHFYGVGMTALVTALAAVALTIVGARRQDGRTARESRHEARPPLCHGAHRHPG